MTISANFPALKPSLLLDFANVERLDPRITFTRASNATYFDANGVLQTASSGVARFDHNPTTLQSLGLLIEEQRTNLLLQSQDFNTTWIKSNVTVVSNDIAAPDGTTTADKITQTSTANPTIRQLVTVSGHYQYSVFLKYVDIQWVRLLLETNAVWFDIQNGVVGTQQGALTGTIVSVGNNWYRCIANAPSLSGALNFHIIGSDGDGSVNEPLGSYHAWGAQLEAGAFPTSYIPTTTAAATRNADVPSMTGTNFSSWYNQSEGTLYADVISAPVNTIVQRYFTISDGTSANIIFGRRTTSGIPAVAMNAGGVTQADISSGAVITGGASFKSSFAYQVNNLAISTNAASVGTDTVATIPVTSSMNIGSNETGTQQVNGYIRRIAYYPVRLSNDQLQALTR